MSWIKSTYINVAQGTLAIGGASRFFTRTLDHGASERRRWLASLAAIYHLDRMVSLDIPWWNVAATRAIEEFLRARPDARVFEYGSGASSLWLAKRVASLTSVEHDAEWLARLASVPAPPSRQLLHRPIGTAEQSASYINAIAEVGGSFDLIVVDGRERCACLEAAIPFLKPDGWLLFDDSGRRRYRAAIKRCGLVEERHFGLSYCVPYPDHSSILRRPDRAQ